MRSKDSTTYVEIRKWEAPGPYPTTEPPSVHHLKHQWSQDLVISENHGFGSRNPQFKTSGDIGGDFLCYKRTYDEGSSLGVGTHGFTTGSELPPAPVGRPYYESPQYAYADEIRNTSFPLPTRTDRSETNIMCAQAIGQIAPNKPKADLATFIGELHEGLPRAYLLRRNGRSRALKGLNAGDEYLNIEFGWKPLIRDVQSFARSVRNSEEILRDFENGAGKLIRRRFDFPTELEISDEVLSSLAYPVPNLEPRQYGENPLGQLSKTTTTRVERWLTAAFMYGLPPRGTPQNYAAKANHLLGTNLDPAMLWNLAPWSWALDWAGNVGSIAENLSLFNSDALVMPWCYFMERKTTKVLYSWRSHSDRVYRTYPGNHLMWQSFETVMKSRIQGSPFGFGIDWPEFTANQLAILGSLGIARRG